MKSFITRFLFLILLITNANATEIIGDSVRLRPATLPTSAPNGELIVDSSTGFLNLYSTSLVAWSPLLSTVGTQTVTNKTIGITNTLTAKDSTFSVQDDGDSGKIFKFQASGLTSGATRTYTMPDASTTLATIDSAQTIASKVFNNSNSYTSTDTLLTLQNNSDTTKQAKFDLSGITTATTRTLTLPNASTTLAGTDATQTLTNKTLTGNTAVNLISGSGTLVLNTSGTATVPNATDTLVGKATSDTLTNKVLTGNTAVNLVSGSGILTLNTSGNATIPNSTDTLVGKATADTLTNKTLTTPIIDVLHQTDQGSTPATPSSGTTKVYSKTDGKVYKLTSAGVEQELGAGAGGGTKNYFSANPDAETATTGWVTYADAAQNTPVDGVNGSPSSTWTRTTSSPLRGTGSFLWTRTAANRQGEGVAYVFTLDDADKAKPLQISFDYKIVSGTFVAADGITAPLNDGTTSQNAGMSDLEVFVYDVTNSALIPVTGQVLTSSSTSSANFKGTFQTSSNGTSYRFILHTARSTAVAFTAQADNFSIGPQVGSLGSPVTDWVAWTPTGSWSTNTTYTGMRRRVGDEEEYRVKVAVSGAPTSASLTVNLPSGITIDSTKVVTAGTENPLGYAIILDSGNDYYFGQAHWNSSTSIKVTVDNSAATFLTPRDVTQAVPFTFGSADAVNIYFSVPVQGFGSTVQMSNDTDTRVNAFSTYLGVSDQTISTTSATKISYAAVVKDTNGTFDTSNNRYVASVSGSYVFYASASIANMTTTDTMSIRIRKNGINQSINSYYTGITNPVINGFAIIDLVAGEYVDATIETSTDTSYLVKNFSDGTRFYGNRLSGPSTIAASETVAMQAVSGNVQALATSGTDVVAVLSSVDDSHGGISGNAYIIPVSGRYFADALNSFASNATGKREIRIQKSTNSGGSWSDFAIQDQPGSAAAQTSVHVSKLLKMNAGDQIRVVLNQTSGGSLSTVSDNNQNFLSIYRVGN